MFQLKTWRCGLGWLGGKIGWEFWSWRLLVKCHRSWSSSIKDYIRTEEFLCVFLSSGDVLALDDCLYLVASCLTILYDLVVL